MLNRRNISLPRTRKPYLGKKMDFAGIISLTLLDYPSKTACTVFTSGCNFRCPFCHNSTLVLPEMINSSAEQPVSEEELLKFLKKRSGLLDGICISGGEPLMDFDGLCSVLPKIKSLGYSVKLDTNGSFPDRLQKLIADGLVDYVAMDIKNSFPHYAETIGIPNFDIAPIKKSIDIIMSSSLDYEFRTTVLHEFHNKERISELCSGIKGASRYFLQQFKDTDNVIKKGLTPLSADEIKEMASAAQKFVPCEIRGI